MRRLTSGMALILMAVLALAGAWSPGAAANEPAKPEKGAEPAKPEKGGEAPKVGQPVSIGMYYDMPDLMANLTTSANARKPVFLKLTLSLQMEHETDRAKLDVIAPLLIDGLQNFLRELRVEDLGGSVGMYRLREELLLRAATIALPVQIKDVLFKEMLVR